jgi:hypothetical protein
MRLYERHFSWIIYVKKDLNIYFGKRKFHNHCIGNVINIWGWFGLNNESEGSHNGNLRMSIMTLILFFWWMKQRETNALANEWTKVKTSLWLCLKEKDNYKLDRMKVKKGHSQDSQNTFLIFNLNISRWQWLKMTYRGDWMASIVSNFGKSKL